MKIVIFRRLYGKSGRATWEPLEKLGQVTVYDRISYEESPGDRRKDRRCGDRGDQ